MVFAVKQRGVCVASVRRDHHVMRKMMAYAVLHAAVGNEIAKAPIEMLNCSTVRCKLKVYAVLRRARTSRAVVSSVMAKAKDEMLNWSNLRCSLKDYAVFEAPWARCGVRLAVCFAAHIVLNL